MEVVDEAMDSPQIELPAILNPHLRRPTTNILQQATQGSSRRTKKETDDEEDDEQRNLSPIVSGSNFLPHKEPFSTGKMRSWELAA